MYSSGICMSKQKRAGFAPHGKVKQFHGYLGFAAHATRLGVIKISGPQGWVTWLRAARISEHVPSPLPAMILVFFTWMNKNILLFRSSTRQYITADICADEGTPTTSASCARHVGVSEKWHTSVLLFHLPIPTETLQHRFYSSKRKPLRSSATIVVHLPWGPRGAQWGDHIAHTVCGQDQLVLRVLHQGPKEMAVFSITCPRDFPIRLLSDLKLLILTEMYPPSSAPTNPASLPYTAQWLTDTLEGQCASRDISLSTQAGSNWMRKELGAERTHSPKSASLLRKTICCLIHLYQILHDQISASPSPGARLQAASSTPLSASQPFPYHVLVALHVHLKVLYVTLQAGWYPLLGFSRQHVNIKATVVLHAVVPRVHRVR